MNILFIHRNFPGQFAHLAPALAARPGCRVMAIGEGGVADPARRPPGVPLVLYRPSRPASGGHRFLRGTDLAVRRGEAVARVAETIRRDFKPDVVVAHIGWGEGLYLRDVFPDARIVAYCEFFYHAEGLDVGFDPEFPPARDAALHLRTRNAAQLLSLDAAHRGLSPTAWQRGVFPASQRDKIAVIHDGIDVARVAPDRDARFLLSDGRALAAGDPVVTYVARNLEPYRGFHVFMRALPQILARHRRAQVVIAGGEEVSYGRPPAEGGSWRTRLLAELGDQLDLSRVHFVGKLPYERYVSLLQVSAAHAYLTYPFVLSWSMLEAMAAGCLMVGSATGPVEEVLSHRQNGLLVDFFARDQIADAVGWALDNPEAAQELRAAARRTAVERFALERCLTAQEAFLDGLARTRPAAPRLRSIA